MIEELKELVVIDGGSKVPPRPKSQRSAASQLFHQLLTVKSGEQRENGRAYNIVMRDWKPCQS